MTLADDVRALRDRVLTDLNAAHDYCAKPDMVEPAQT